MGEIFLKDHYGRVFNNLRISLLEACNFGCIYCSPPKKENFKDTLSAQEIKDIAGNLIDLGVEKIKLTGGEPTLRKDFKEIVLSLGGLNIKKLGVTSNGLYIDKYLDDFKQAGLRHINVSLDSLNESAFQKMTKVNCMKKVVNNILLLKEHSEFNVKINCVLMKGINSHEIGDFIEFSKKYEVQIRFLELMQIGVANQFHEKHFYPQKEVMSYLLSRYRLKRVETPPDSTSVVYQLDNGAEIGFISSETAPFCSSCSRLRLTARGKLKICLFKNEEVDLKGLERESYKETLSPLLKLKPMTRIKKIDQMMYQIGG